MKIISEESAERARREIEKAFRNNEDYAVLGRDAGFNRKILENKKSKILILQNKIGKDKLKERDSGLNHVLCKIAKQNNISIAFDFSELFTENKKEKAKILGRMIQNIKLIKKCKNKLIIFKKPADSLSLASFLRVLGADSKLASIVSKSQ